MKFKGVIIWIIAFFAGCVAMHHICENVRVQLQEAAQQHQRALEDSTDVR